MTRTNFAAAYNTAAMLRDRSIANVLTHAALVEMREPEHIILAGEYMECWHNHTQYELVPAGWEGSQV